MSFWQKIRQGWRDSDQAMPVLLVLMAACSQVSTAGFSIFLGIAVLYFLRDAVWHREKLCLPRWLWLVVGLYVVAGFFGALFSLEPQVSLGETSGAVGRLVPLVLAAIYVRSWRAVCGIVLALAFSTLVDGVVASYQAAFDINCGWGPGRPTGLVRSPTFLGSFMLISLPVLLLLPSRLPLSRNKKTFALLVGAFALVVLFLSGTRGAWLAFAVVLLALIVLERQKRKLYALAAVGLLLLSCVAFHFSPYLAARGASIANTHFQSNTERVLMWQSSWQIFKDHPLFGVGRAEWGLVYNSRYISPLAKERPKDPINDPRGGHSHPHNNFMEVLSEQGIFGMTFFLLLHFSVLFALFRAFRAARPGSAAYFALLAGILVWLGVQLDGMTDTSLHLTHISRAYWLTMGLCLAAGRLAEPEKEMAET